MFQRPIPCDVFIAGTAIGAEPVLRNCLSASPSGQMYCLDPDHPARWPFHCSGTTAGSGQRGDAGLKDGIDHHCGCVLRAALLSTLLKIGAELGADGDDPIASAIRNGAQDTIGDAGRKIARRQIDIPPTLTVRPGFRVRVIVSAVK